MQTDKKQIKNKYTYINDSSICYNQRNDLIQCIKCKNWEQKLSDLIGNYQHLLMVKEKQVETITAMVNQLTNSLEKSNLKVQTLQKKMRAYEQQINNIKISQQNHDEIVDYYRDRQSELLAQMASIENELFTKNIKITDENEMKEEKAINQVNIYQGQSQVKINRLASNTHLLPTIASSKSFGKLLQRNVCNIQKMNQQKMALQIKHRMAVLRAVQLNVLK